MEENSKVQKETKENKPKELDVKSSTLEDSIPEKPSRKESTKPTKDELSKSQIVKEVISEKEESNTKAEKKDEKNEKEESKDLIASNPEATSIDSKDEAISPEIEEQREQDLSELLNNSITSATAGLTKQFNDLRDSTLELFRNVGRELSGQKTDLKAMSKDFKDFDQKVFHQQGNKNDEIGKATEVGTRGTVQNRGQNRGIYSDQADYSESGGGSPELGSIVTILGMGAQALNAGWNYFFGDDDKKKEETTPGSVTDNSSSEKPWWKFWSDDEKPKEAKSKEIPKDVIKEEISKESRGSVTDNSSSEKPWWKFWSDEKPKESKIEKKKKSSEEQIDSEFKNERERYLYNRVANYISGRTYDELEDLMGFPKGFLKGKDVVDTIADDSRSIKATIYDKENNKVWNHRTYFDEFGNPTNSTLEIIEGEDADIEIKTRGLQDKLLFDKKIGWNEAHSKSGGFVDDVKTTVEEKPWWKFWGDDVIKETKTRRLRDDIDGTLYKLNEDELKIMYSRAKEDGIPFDEETEKFFQKRFNYFKKKRERKGTGALEFDETNSDHMNNATLRVSDKPTNSKDTLSDTVGEVKKATEELKVTEKEARKEDEKSKEQIKETTKGVADTSVTDMSSFRVDSTTPSTTGTVSKPTLAPSLPKAPQQQAAPSGGGGGGTANITIAPTKAEKSQQKDTSSTPSATGSARTPTDNSSIPAAAGETPGGDSSKKIESKNPTIDSNTKNMLEQSTPPASKETTKIIKDEVKVVDKNGAEPDPTSYFTSESLNSVYRGNY